MRRGDATRIKWKMQKGLDAATRYAGTWDGCNQSFFGGHPLLDSRFVLPLVRHFGNDHTLLCTVEPTRDQPHDGALLLQPRMNGIWSTFLPSQAQISPVVLSPTSVSSALVALMHQLPSRCWMLEMLKQDSHYSCFRESEPERLDQNPHATTINVAIERTFEQYWDQRPKKLRENIRRYFNRLNKRGVGLELKIIQTPQEIAAAVARYGELENAGWKGKQGTAIHPDNVQGRFYADVMRGFAKSGNAVVYELYLNDRLAASRLVVENGRMVVALKTTYDEQFSRFAPGRLLLYLFLEQTFRNAKHTTVEFYTNATKDTLQWATGSRTIHHVNFYSGELARSGFRLVRRLRSRVSATSSPPERAERRPDRDLD